MRGEEKNYLWFYKYILGQSIFMGSRKSITLTSPEGLHKVGEQANRHEAIRTHQGLATPAGEILLLVGAGEGRRQAILRGTHLRDFLDRSRSRRRKTFQLF
jgi:hypothetical protein